VKIQLYKGNTKDKDIALKAANSGTYSWTIPAAQAPASNYRVKITTTDNIFSAFSGYFSIVKPSITITSPAAGVTWTRGTGYQITWNKAGEQNASVSIQLFKGTKMVQTISPSAPNSGSFSWTVPTSLAAGINYKVKIKTVDNLVTAISKLFKIN
jgi:hypothetical protein